MMKIKIEQIVNKNSIGILEYARQLDYQINSEGKYRSLIKNYKDPVSQKSIKLFHFSNSSRHILLPLIKNKSSENFVIIHDVISRNLIKKWLSPFFIWIICKKSKFIIVHTEAAKKLLIDIYIRINPDKICVIPHGTNIIDTSKEIHEKLRFHYKIDKDQKVLFMLGRISSERGSINFLRAFIKANKSDIYLIVSGKCTDKRAIELLNSNARIRYIGLADNDLVNDCFKLCNGVVVYRDNWAGESSSTIVYSLGYGIPVFASDTPSFREMIGDAGILFQNNDSAILDVLKLFVTDKDKMCQLQQNTKLVREQYKWETYIEKLTVICGINEKP